MVRTNDNHLPSAGLERGLPAGQGPSPLLLNCKGLFIRTHFRDPNFHSWDANFLRSAFVSLEVGFFFCEWVYYVSYVRSSKVWIQCRSTHVTWLRIELDVFFYVLAVSGPHFNISFVGAFVISEVWERFCSVSDLCIVGKHLLASLQWNYKAESNGGNLA